MKSPAFGPVGNGVLISKIPSARWGVSVHAQKHYLLPRENNSDPVNLKWPLCKNKTKIASESTIACLDYSGRFLNWKPNGVKLPNASRIPKQSISNWKCFVYVYSAAAINVYLLRA